MSLLTIKPYDVPLLRGGLTRRLPRVTVTGAGVFFVSAKARIAG